MRLYILRLNQWQWHPNYFSGHGNFLTRYNIEINIGGLNSRTGFAIELNI